MTGRSRTGEVAMAEYAERKLRTAKLSVALAIAAVLGGLAARDQSAQATTAEPGAGPQLAKAPITSAEIKNSSLLFKDFKAGQVYSDNEVNHKFLKIEDANAIFAKIDDANNTFIKIEDANNTFIKGEVANNTFLKIEDAKNQFVQGNGSVLTGFEAVTGNNASAPILDLLGMVRAEGVVTPQQNQPQARLTNLGTTPLHYATGGTAGVMAPNAQGVLIGLGGGGGGSATVQLISEGSPPEIATLTLSAIPAGGTTNFSGQALLGAGQ
jgi:hypothetical protein